MTDNVLGFDADYTMPKPARLALAGSPEFLDVYAMNATTVSKGELAFNVRDYGAVGDGITDDTAAIQDAITDAAAKGSVLIPAGDYHVGGLIRLPGQTHIVGYGATFHRRTAVGDVFQNWAAGDTTTTAYNGASDIVIEGLSIDQHGDTLTGEANVVTFEHCHNITIRNVSVLRWRGFHALELNAVDGASVENCRFLGYAAGTQTDKEAIQIDCASEFVNAGAADGTMAKNITVTRTIFAGYGTMGAPNTGVGAHGVTGTGMYDGINVTSCTFDGCIRGVRAYGFRNSVIADSRFVVAAGGQGVRVEAAQGVIIHGCTIVGGAFGVGMQSGCVSCTVSGCRITGSGQDVYDGATDAWTQIVGNNIRRTTSYAVTIDAAISAMVASNTFDGAGYAAGASGAVRLTGVAAGPSVTGNKTILHGAGTEVAAGVSIAATVTDAWVFGNDFKGLAAAVAGTANTTSNRI